MAAMAAVVQCPRDPAVETALRCGRCDTPICPRCLVQSPVGARCKDCGKIQRNPIYQVKGTLLVRAVAAAVIGGLLMGFAWWLVLLPFTGGFLSIFLGVGLAYLFTRLMDEATRRKRGPVVIGLAIGGIDIAWAVLVVMSGWDIARFALLAVAVGAYFSYQNLK